MNKSNMRLNRKAWEAPRRGWLKVLLKVLSLVVGVGLAGVSTLSAFPRIFETGTTIYDPAQAYNSYVIFSAPDGKTHLIDLDGNEVHSWPYVGFPAGLLDPKLTGGQLGHVLLQLKNGQGRERGFFSNQVFGELDWDGKAVWEWGEQAPGGAADQHHDWARLPNGNTLILSNVTHPVKGLVKEPVHDQVIYEVTPDGKIAWTWTAGDHLDEFGFSPTDLQYLREVVGRGKNVEYLHFNNMKPVGPNHWFDEGDQRFNPDNIITDSRNANFIIIIDKKTGKVVWRLGPDFPRVKVKVTSQFVDNPQGQLPRPVDQISGQHDAQIIPEGVPGAGDLLVFDNQGSAGYPPVSLLGGSRVLEINPVTKQIVWQYTGEDSGRTAWTFRSHFVSDARRLPNGNTFIDEGSDGRFFQITPTGKIVWEYVNPYVNRPGDKVWAPTGNAQVVSNYVYRAIPVPYEWVPAGTAHSEKPVAEPDIFNLAPVRAK
jgi:Arylsulfotransferase (ASST)